MLRCLGPILLFAEKFRIDTTNLVNPSQNIIMDFFDILIEFFSLYNTKTQKKSRN